MSERQGGEVRGEAVPGDEVPGDGAGRAGGRDRRPRWPPRELVDSLLGSFTLPGRGGSPSDPPDPADAEARAAARRFRDVLGRFCTGVTVVTSTGDGEPVGLTCQSFASVSLDPPLVAFVPARTARAWPAIERAGHFCVNVLSREQEGLSNRFASRGVDKFAGVAWSPAPSGSPLLDGVVAWIDCTVEAVHEAGDHRVVIGRVRDLGVGSADDPLLFFEGRYRSLE